VVRDRHEEHGGVLVRARAHRGELGAEELNAIRWLPFLLGQYENGGAAAMVSPETLLEQANH